MCEEIRAERETCLGALTVWFLSGAALGLAIGLLYAPRSGRATREAISGTSRDLYGRSREMYQKGRIFVDDTADLWDRGRRMARGGLE